MKTLKILLLSLVLGFSLLGCDESMEPKTWIENTNRFRNSAMYQKDNIPYRATQHQVLKNYFTELGKMALYLKNSESLVEQFNETFEEGNISQICSKLFIKKTDWDSIVNNCTKNRFFLCAEEVRAYSEIISSLRGKLNPGLQRKFNSTESCKTAF
ncbi:MAG: hypothetical protein AB7F43_12340 [Bacteriovoracia bacterium]